MTAPTTAASRASGPGQMFSIASELCRLAAWFEFEGRHELSLRLLHNAEWFLRLRAGHDRFRVEMDTGH
jgi:hypothetical protein